MTGVSRKRTKPPEGGFHNSNLMIAAMVVFGLFLGRQRIDPADQVALHFHVFFMLFW
jgi:hypothetical protein